MSALITERQWEQLSAYLDGELSSKEKSSLDSQLKSSQELTESLETLRQTRQFLKNLPKRSVPRNFTLTPEMAGIKTRQPLFLFPVFSAVSAIAALLFFITLLFGRSAPSEMSVAMMEAPAQEKALTSATAETAAKPTPWIIYWGYGSYATDGRGGYGGGSEAQFATVPESAIPPAPGTMPQPKITTNQQEEQAPLTGSGPILGVQPTTPVPVLTAPPVEDETVEITGAAERDQTGLLIVFAVLALASAGAAYTFWRRSKL